MKLEERIGKILTEKGLKIAISESCTGGLVGHLITNVSGSSNYFEASLVTYSNESKWKFLNVDKEVLDEKGAVSEEVAVLMAKGVRKATGVDIGLSVTGIAGPTGGTKDKPVGLVYIGLSVKEGDLVRKFLFSGERMEIKEKAAYETLNLLLDYLEGRLF
ncbi:MAG: CinA family protein [Desulfobacterota bacterium]|nr:CinA family protein [Thermodesulfobacteriota bacterium]MDW8001746.1 CinA family protein [Deltaproteobacteria bacterium]